MAETAATLSLAIKLSDQLTAELKKVADTTKRETDRAAKSVAGLDTSFGRARTTLKDMSRNLRDLAGGFGFGAAFGLSLTSIVDRFAEWNREVIKTERSLQSFARFQRIVGRESGLLGDAIRKSGQTIKAAFGIETSESAGAALTARALGLQDGQITRALEDASALSQAYGVTLNDAITAVSLTVLGASSGYEKLGESLGVVINNAADAERAMRILRLEYEKASIQNRSGSYAPFGLSVEDNARIRAIDRETASRGGLRARPTAVDAENDALRLRTVQAIERLTAQASALNSSSANATREERISSVTAEFDRAQTEVLRDTLALQKQLLASNLPGADGLARSLGDQRDDFSAAVQRKQRVAVAQINAEEDAKIFDRELEDSERELRQRRPEERDPRYADRGQARALADIKAEYNDLNQRAYESTRRLAQGLEDNFADAFQSVLDGSEDLGAAVNNLFRGLVSDLTQEAARQVSKSLVGLIFGAGDRGMTTDGAGFSGSSLMSSARFLSAYSNAPMRALADGGVLYRPTLAVAGENGPEAFVPLRGGKIPVSVNGAGGSTVVNLTLNVSSWDGQDAARSVQKAMPQIVAGVQKAIATDRSMRSAIKSA